jgi:hypothetical protein
MKRQSLVLLAVAFIAAGAAGCFSDPVSGLRGGPSIVNLSASVLLMSVGDSTTVSAQVQDNQGNALAATGTTWASSASAVATAGADNSLVIPGDYYSRGYIKAKAVGTSNVTVTARGVSAIVKVTVH